MSRYLIAIDLQGDPGSIECVIDELLASIGFMDLDHCCVKIDNVECIGHD